MLEHLTIFFWQVTSFACPINAFPNVSTQYFEKYLE